MPAVFMSKKWAKRYISAEAKHSHRRADLKDQHEIVKALFRAQPPFPHGLPAIRELRKRNTAYLGTLATLRRMHLEFHIQITKEITARELATTDAPSPSAPPVSSKKGPK